MRGAGGGGWSGAKFTRGLGGRVSGVDRGCIPGPRGGGLVGERGGG